MLYQPTFLFIGGLEIMFILAVLVVVLGPSKLPEIARNLGKGMRTLRDATADIKQEVANSVNVQETLKTDLTQSINDEINKVKDDVEDFAGSVKRDM